MERYWRYREAEEGDQGTLLSFNPKVLLGLLQGKSYTYKEFVLNGNGEELQSTYVLKCPIRWVLLKASKIHPKVCAEIGVQFGYNAFDMCRVFHPEELCLIDPYQEEPTPDNGLETSETSMESAHELLSTVPTKVRWFRQRSQEAHQNFKDGYFDFVFIDGDHGYEAVKQDIEAWYPKVRPGGIFAGDDYAVKYPGVIKAVDEAFPDCEKNGREWLVRK